MGLGNQNSPLLVIEHLSVSYNGSPVLKDLCLNLWDQQIAAIVGADGAGKTTFLKAVGGLIHPISGRIYFDGEAIETLPIWEIVQRGVIYVPEGMKVFAQMSVLENLEVGAYLNRHKIPERLDIVFTIFPELKERRKTLAGVLSGGQQRMVTLARGLMSGVRLLLLDDPFLGLSPKLVKRFCDTFKTLKKNGITLFIASQEVRRILTVADLAYLIEDGSITLSGSGSDILQDQRLQQVLFDSSAVR